MKQNDQPPLWIWIIILILTLVVYRVVSDIKTAPEGNQEAEITFQELFYRSNMPFIPDTEVLGVMLYGIEIDPLLNKIIDCESKFDPNACNGENCQYGRGLIQLVSGTEGYCEKKLGREIDPFNPVDNLECGKYLYEESTDHWGTEETSWGSYYCWKSEL